MYPHSRDGGAVLRGLPTAGARDGLNRLPYYSAAAARAAQHMHPHSRDGGAVLRGMLAAGARDGLNLLPYYFDEDKDFVP